MTPQPAVAITTSEPQRAPELARSIVAAGLAACVQLIPQMRSFYVWEGAVQDDAETLLLIKTDIALRDRLIGHIKKVHSYDVPELVFLNIDDGLPAYLDWITTVLNIAEG